MLFNFSGSVEKPTKILKFCKIGQNHGRSARKIFSAVSSKPGQFKEINLTNTCTPFHSLRFATV